MESALKEVFNVHRTIVRDLRRELYKAENEKKDIEQWLYNEIKTEVIKILNGLRAVKTIITAEKCYSCHCSDGHVSQSLVLDLLEQKVQLVECVLSDISTKPSIRQQSMQGNDKVMQVKGPSKTLLSECRSQQTVSIEDHAPSVGEPGSRAAVAVETQAADNRLQLTRHAGKRRRYTQAERDDSGRKDKARLGSSKSRPAEAPVLADGGTRTGPAPASVRQPPDSRQACGGTPTCLVSETCPTLLRSPSRQAGASVAHTLRVVPETLQLDDEPCYVDEQEGTVVQRTLLEDQRESTEAREDSLVTAASAVFRSTRGPASPASFLSSSNDSSTLKEGRTPSPVFDHAHCSDTSFGGQSPALFDELPNKKDLQKLQFPTPVSVSHKDLEPTSTKNRCNPVVESVKDISSQTAVDVTMDPNFHGLNHSTHRTTSPFDVTMDPNFHGLNHSTHRTTSPFDVTMDPNFSGHNESTRRIASPFDVTMDPDFRGQNDSTHLTAPLCDVTFDPKFRGQNDSTHLTAPLCDVTLDPRFPGQTNTQCTASPCKDSASLSQLQTPPYNDTFDRVPTRKSNNNFAYLEVVRKQVERRKLDGFSCKECSKYYSAMGLTDAEKAQRMAQCSRHRAKQAPPSTPEHFWSLGFPDTDWQPTAGH